MPVARYVTLVVGVFRDDKMVLRSYRLTHVATGLDRSGLLEQITKDHFTTARADRCWIDHPGAGGHFVHQEFGNRCSRKSMESVLLEVNEHQVVVGDLDI